LKILDLFCGVGGSAMGIRQAFPKAEIVGVDLKDQPRYPFHFVQADALKFDDGGFDFVWASPPCQRYTQMLNHGLTNRDKHPDLVAKTRRKLIKSGLPWVMENVPNSPLRKDLVLCGEMFGLRVTRHRVFECSFPVPQPAHIPHRGTGIRNQKEGGYYFRVYGHETGKKEWGKAMGMVGPEWVKGQPKYYEIAQAVPPAYSNYIFGYAGKSSI
jgi:DNA (cytosine-5)-methyltransferase 1